MRLVDADDVIKAVDKHTKENPEIVLDEDISCILEEVPTVDAVSRAEAIEVVCDKCPISFKEKCEWRDNGHCSMKVALESLPSKIPKE